MFLLLSESFTADAVGPVLIIKTNLMKFENCPVLPGYSIVLLFLLRTKKIKFSCFAIKSEINKKINLPVALGDSSNSKEVC